MKVTAVSDMSEYIKGVLHRWLYRQASWFIESWYGKE